MARRRFWKEKHVKAVCHEMEQGILMSVACRMHHIPYSTFKNYMKGRRPVGSKSGPDGYLSKAEEKHITEWCNDMARKGFGLETNTFRKVVATLVQEIPKRQQFKGGGMVSRGWLQRFTKRHKILLKSSNIFYTAKKKLEYEEQFKRQCEEFCSEDSNDSDDSEDNTSTKERSTSNLNYIEERNLSPQTDNSNLWDSKSDFISDTVLDSISTPRTPSTYAHSSTNVPSSPSSAPPLTCTKASKCEQSSTGTATSKHAQSLRNATSSAPPLFLDPEAVITPPSSPVDQQIKRMKFDAALSEEEEEVKSSKQIHDQLFSESVAKQILAILSKSDRKRGTRLKIKILEFLESLSSSDEEM